MADDEVAGDTSESPPASDSADDSGPPPAEEAPSEDSSPSEDPPATEDPPPVEDTPPVEEEHQMFTVTTIPEFARAAVESDAGNTMASIVRDLFGRYTPKVQTVSTYVDGELASAEEQYVPGVAGMDWEWIAGFAVFLLMLYCLFRLLGGSVKVETL